MTQTQSDWYLTTSSLGSSNSSATPAVLSPLPALPTGKSLNQSQNLIHTYIHTYVRATVKKKTCCRYGKEYESVEEIKLRFQIFSDNLKLIRSTNRKASSYKLAVNRKPLFFFLSFFLSAVGLLDFSLVVDPLLCLCLSGTYVTCPSKLTWLRSSSYLKKTKSQAHVQWEILADQIKDWLVSYHKSFVPYALKFE